MVEDEAGSNKVNVGNATGKIGFYATTPVVQQAGVTVSSDGFTAGVGTAVKDGSTFTGGTGSLAYHISDIVLALKNMGLLDS